MTTRAPSAAAGLAFVLTACAVGDDTVVVDGNGNRYAAEVFCAGDFEGVRVSMVPGPDVDLSPLTLPEESSGCVRLRLAQTTQGPFDVAINEGFVLVGGTLEEKIDCRIGAEFVGTATAPRTLTDATGEAIFEDGAEGALSMEVDAGFGAVQIPLHIDGVDVRRGGCDLTFD